jgi:hypothetical protein
MYKMNLKIRNTEKKSEAAGMKGGCEKVFSVKQQWRHRLVRITMQMGKT